MANDHFVARTYLKRLCDRDKDQPMQAYRKPSGTPFPCWPESVCAETGGDLNPNYFEDADVLGQFRAIIKPREEAAIDAIEKCKLTIDDKFVIAGYWANLLAATPGWRKIGQEIYEQEVLSTLPMITTNLPDSLKDVRLSVEVDEDYIKAIATKQLLAHALQLYHQSWTILANDTAHEFLTSDNPSAVYPPPAPGGPVGRILPLSPRLCISTIMERPVYRKVVTRADLAEPPKAWVTYRRIEPKGVKLANRLTVVNAERFVFSRVASSGVAALVKKYGDYSAQLEHSVSPTPEGDGISEARLFIGKNRSRSHDRDFRSPPAGPSSKWRYYMSAMRGLKFSNTPTKSNDPVGNRRMQLVKKLEEQKLLAADPNYVRKSTRFVGKGEARHSVVKEQRVRV